MQTIETDKTVVNVLVWPAAPPGAGRDATTGTLEDGRCTLVLTERVFRDPKRANAAYRRFARRMERAGLEPPNVVFHEMTSEASRGLFCVLSPRQSLFNTACPLGPVSLLDVGSDERRMVMGMVRTP